jgi:hypothetical protein
MCDDVTVTVASKYRTGVSQQGNHLVRCMWSDQHNAEWFVTSKRSSSPSRRQVRSLKHFNASNVALLCPQGGEAQNSRKSSCCEHKTARTKERTDSQRELTLCCNDENKEYADPTPPLDSSASELWSPSRQQHLSVKC